MRAALLLLWAGCATLPPRPPQSELAQLVDGVRAKHGVPGMGVALLRAGQPPEIAVAGLRRAGGTEWLLPDDRFHLGSDTKAMTASIIARLAERNLIRWDEKLDVPGMHPDFREVTLAQVARHLAGLAAGGTDELVKGIDYRWPVERQRQWLTERILSRPPAHAPGKFEYSNWDFVILGHLAEARSGKSWEQLMREEVFAPLHMQGCGFGPTGSQKDSHQNWAHRARAGGYHPTGEDNPPLVGPAGTVHCPLAAWARFAAAHQGANPGWLSPSSLAALHHSDQIPGMGAGWGVAAVRGQAALTHDGSNGLNYARIVLFPTHGLLITANAGDARAAKAVNELTHLLVDRMKEN
jgi:D-alanyl-D-alanine carboxypeptidase